MKIQKYKIIISLILLVVLMLSFNCSVFATTYNSTLKLSFRSTQTGTYRSYTGKTLSISILLSNRDNPDNSDNYCEVILYKENGTVAGSQTLNLKTIGKTYSASFRIKSGEKYQFFFTNMYPYNDDRSAYIDGFSSKKVVMSSK